MSKKTNKMTLANCANIDIKIKDLNICALDNIQIDKADLLEPQKDTLAKYVVTAYDSDFCDSESVLEYQPDEHSERKQILVYKTRFYAYMVSEDLKTLGKELYTIDVSTKRPNYAKSLLALKLTKEHYNIKGQMYPVIELMPNYVQFNDNIIYTYMLCPLND